MDSSQNITLTPDQYATLSGAMRNLGGPRVLGAMPISGDSGITGYSMPSGTYNSAYTQANNYGLLSRGNGLPSPASLTAPVAAPAAPPANPNLTTPTYAQFAQNFANRASPVQYTGGAAPAGMNASDAALLQSIYAPKTSTGVAPAAAKATGGFVAPNAIGQQFADGGALGDGMPTGAEMGTWVTRREATDATHSSGLFNSPVPGRTDKLDTLVPAGAYVIPADVVSGLGEGNTMAGSAVLDKMFHSNPFGIKGQSMHGGVGIPHPPAAYRQPRAAGGAADGHVPIVAAGGEYLIHPSAVRALGGGNIKKGHKILDHFVLHARKNIVKETSKLPGPKK